jgi:hypothetical protein
MLTDQHRVAVSRELWVLHIERGYVHMDQTLTTYEREAKERMATARDAEAKAIGGSAVAKRRAGGGK